MVYRLQPQAHLIDHHGSRLIAQSSDQHETTATSAMNAPRIRRPPPPTPPRAQISQSFVEGAELEPTRRWPRDTPSRSRATLRLPPSKYSVTTEASAESRCKAVVVGFGRR